MCFSGLPNPSLFLASNQSFRGNKGKQIKEAQNGRIKEACRKLGQHAEPCVKPIKLLPRCTSKMPFS